MSAQRFWESCFFTNYHDLHSLCMYCLELTCSEDLVRSAQSPFPCPGEVPTHYGCLRLQVPPSAELGEVFYYVVTMCNCPSSIALTQIWN